MANFGRSSPDKDDRHPVEVDDPRFRRNAFGLAQMHGNVCEWCEDVYDAKAYAGRGELTVDPLQGGDGMRVRRSGFFHARPGHSSYRSITFPTIGFGSNGMRVAKSQ